MTRFPARSPALAAAAILAASRPGFSSRVARSNFDGQWSVLIVTQKGTCDRAYRYPVKIDNGSVGYAGDASFTVSGKVGDNGTVTVTVARGSQSANGQGRLSATDGSGMWIAGSGECSGHLDGRAPLLVTLRTVKNSKTPAPRAGLFASVLVSAVTASFAMAVPGV